MKEKNYDRLRRALDRLPEHDPAPRAWDAVRAGLDRSAAGAAEPLGGRLPTYAPPAGVWNALSKDLDAAPRRTGVHRLLGSRKLGAVAAAVAFVLLAGAGVLLYDAGPRVSYAYSQEPLPEPVVADWDQEQPSFERARAAVRDRNEPHLNNLGHELDELNSAREEVKAMLVAYGEDPGIVRQLADIERERDDVYRRIIVEL